MSKPHPLSIPIESLRPGTFTDGNNATWSFSEGDIADLAAGYDATRNPAPVVIGHPKMDSPAVGIISAASKVGENRITSYNVCYTKLLRIHRREVQ